jgi:hypothetical protein
MVKQALLIGIWFIVLPRAAIGSGCIEIPLIPMFPPAAQTATIETRDNEGFPIIIEATTVLANNDIGLPALISPLLAARPGVYADLRGVGERFAGSLGLAAGMTAWRNNCSGVVGFPPYLGADGRLSFRFTDWLSPGLGFREIFPITDVGTLRVPSSSYQATVFFRFSKGSSCFIWPLRNWIWCNAVWW